MKFEELIEGKYYITLYSGRNYIVRIFRVGNCPHIEEMKAYGSSGNFQALGDLDYENATPEEIAHLQACEAADMYVPPPQTFYQIY